MAKNVPGENRSKPEVNVNENGNTVNFFWTKEHARRCSSKWLRLNCRCSECERSDGKIAIEDTIQVVKTEIEGNSIKCVGSGDGDHVIEVPLERLLSSCNCESCLKNEISLRRRIATDQSVPYIQYQSLSSDEWRFSFLEKIVDYGFCVVRDFPADDNEILLNFVRTMGGIRSTLYGHDWIVCSQANPNNAAYTPLKLPSHNDLVMYETSPGVQFLLALRFDEEVVGGQSIIVDGIKCAEILRQNHPEHFETLRRVPATFDSIDMGRDSPAWLWHSKPHFEVDYFGEIVAVNWHPGLESTLKIREEDTEAYYKAHKAFMEILRDPKNQIVFRLRVGDLMVLNNHRVMHARASFQSNRDGDRHLLGCYMNVDDFKSHYMELAAKLKKKVSPPKIGNRSSF